MYEAKYKVIDKNSNSVLFECSANNKELAYSEAKKFESFDLNVEIIGPTLPEDLILALGAEQADLMKLNQDLELEIHEHPNISGSCCFTDKN